MSEYNLDKYNNKQLLEIIVEAQKLIKKNENAEKAELKKKMAALAAERGYSIEEILGEVKSTATRKVAPKYRDPDSGATWTGRGRKPKWVAEIVEGGGNIEDYAI